MQEHLKRPIIIDDKILAELVEHKDQTGLSPAELLKKRHDIPPGLCVSLIDHWFNQTTTTTRKDYLDYVRLRYERHMQSQGVCALT